MPVLLLLPAPHTRGDEVTGRWAGVSGYRVAGVDELVGRSARESGFPADGLRRAIEGDPPVLDGLARGRERAVAHLRAGMARLLEEDRIVHCGPTSLLVPRSIGFCLRVALVAPRDWRARSLAASAGLAPGKAARALDQADVRFGEWARRLVDGSPFDLGLHDILLPMHETTVERAVEIIGENVGKPPLARDARSAAALADFRLAARVQVALADAGHDTSVESENGYATVSINRHSLLLGREEAAVRALAGAVEGVRGVAVRVGPGFRRPGIFRSLDGEAPPSILLVDDEREFALTLSERLATRDFGTSVAHSGEEALAAIEREEPDVVVLDLQMPGIGGIEVLRRVRRGHPRTSIVILTGHGSEAERALAAELGAFAYLTKPVDILVLTRVLSDAHRRIREGEPPAGRTG